MEKKLWNNLAINMNIVSYYREVINNILIKEFSLKKDDIKNTSFEFPKDFSLGDFSTNAAMVLSGKLKKSPKQIAEIIINLALKNDDIEKAEIAGKGFINITIKSQIWQELVFKIIKKESSYGDDIFGNNEKINVEYVSANPTGPLHVGHGRGAAYGDAIGRILSSSGFRVEREYYINDAGRQIDILTASVFIRVFQNDFGDFFPKNAYKGSYISDIGNSFYKQEKPKSLEDISTLIEKLPEDEEKEIDELILRIKNHDLDIWNLIKDFSLDEVLASIKKDLELFNVSFDHWFFESSLGDISDEKSQIASAIKTLKDKNLAYEESDAIWLNTSATGDDKNRVLIRDDGRATYFASDVAYHKDKIDRGFDKLVNVWGADHHGYIKRIEASMEGLGFSKEKLDVQLVQFANLFKDGSKVKMSTRSGDFYSLADLIKEIGTDAARFYYLSKQADQHLDFDLNLAKSDSKENIFYYIQYAHARIFSLLSKYEARYSAMPSSSDAIRNGSYESCDKLIHEMSKFPTIVLRSSSALQPHLIIFYLKDFAHAFHSFYNDNHVLTESKENMDSIIYCLSAAKAVISNGLNLLGIEPMEKM